MVDDLTNLTTNEKQSTRKTRELTQNESLQVLADVLKKYQSLGGEVLIMPEFWYSGTRAVAIFLPGLKIVDGSLVHVPEK